MKKLLLLALLPAALFAQDQLWLDVQVYTNMTVADSIRTNVDTLCGYFIRKSTVQMNMRQGNDTLICHTDATNRQTFSTVIPSQVVYYTTSFIPAGTTVLECVNDTTIILSAVLLASDTLDLQTVTFIKPEAAVVAAVAGEVLHSSVLKFPTTVLSKIDTNRIRLSQNAVTNSANGATVNFAQYKGSDSQYSTGDIIGTPFRIAMSPGQYHLEQVLVSDSGKQAANMEVILLDTTGVWTGIDNGAFDVSNMMLKRTLGIAPLSAFGAYANSSVAYSALSNYMPIKVPRGGYIYGALISKGTGTYVGLTGLKIRFTFSRN